MYAIRWLMLTNIYIKKNMFCDTLHTDNKKYDDDVDDNDDADGVDLNI